MPQEALQGLESLLSPASFDGGAALQMPSMPQSEALIWLANNKNLDARSKDAKAQRRALAALRCSTNGAGWHCKAGWAADQNECEWRNAGDSPLGTACSSFCKSGSFMELDLGCSSLAGTTSNKVALLSGSVGKALLALIVV